MIRDDFPTFGTPMTRRLNDFSSFRLYRNKSVSLFMTAGRILREKEVPFHIILKKFIQWKRAKIFLSQTCVTFSPWAVLQSVKRMSIAYPSFFMESTINGRASFGIRSHLFRMRKCGRTPKSLDLKSSFRPERGICSKVKACSTRAH